ncbi:MFS transporter [Pectobacterium brasiliense]|uniref:MFS transporter n=1 Tax=Pectobacterium brasiliense TaxID=180957 RepID=UPI00057C5970|nr:MFS transporter [Pectobacterium brasiliense]KHS76675.1 MFS transporter [Pectobacterium brasiliense]KHS90334.1 MFS transporter [Pectobacterium brasiliense]MBN3172028.1 MFS transporter [Pectobacterium brasiliense]UDQ77464.1 MFS transporter [Pectobacterium brasiliense]
MAVTSTARTRAFLFFTIILLGLNLRPVLAGIGPLLNQIQAATGLDDSMAGMLTTLPVFAMGWCALYGGQLQVRLGEYRGITLGIVVIALACSARWWLNSGIALLVSAALAGIGIALIQALVPSFIKLHFGRHSSLLMGFYTTAIMTGAAFAASSVSPLANVWGWQSALACWGIVALVAAVAWRSIPKVYTVKQDAVAVVATRRSGMDWLLMVFFGIGTGAYTLVLAWLPPYYIQLGLDATQSGLMLGGLTLTEVISGLLVSTFINRFPDRRKLLLPILTVMLVGMIGLIVAPLTFTYPIIIMLGVGIGALFPLSLIVALDQVTESHKTGSLMGFVQGGGYILASLMPLLAGFIRQHTAGLEQAWMIMTVGVVVLILMATRFAPVKSPSR